MSKKYYDISLEISTDMIIYPGDFGVEIKEKARISDGDKCNLSIITLGSHTGTHIDAPKHFLDNGLTVNELRLDYFIGKAKVYEIMAKDTVDVTDLEALDIRKDDIVLLKTRNSDLLKNSNFDQSFAYVTPGAARYLADIGIRTLGFDYLSVEKFSSTLSETHHSLLSAGIVIIEGLALADIEPGEYEIIALPIKIKNGNGSPARVVLVEE